MTILIQRVSLCFDCVSIFGLSFPFMTWVGSPYPISIPAQQQRTFSLSHWTVHTFRPMANPWPTIGR